MPNTEQKRWIAAQLRPNCHQMAKRNLERQGFEPYLPTLAVTMRRGAEFVKAERPLFPGYIFVPVIMGTAAWRLIGSTHGISRIVTFGDASPATIPDELVAAMMSRWSTASSTISAGDKVRVVSGPFADFIAEVERREEDERIWVLLDVLGRRSRVGLLPQEIQKF